MHYNIYTITDMEPVRKHHEDYDQRLHRILSHDAVFGSVILGVIGVTGIAGFGLGRLSVITSEGRPVTIERTLAAEQTAAVSAAEYSDPVPKAEAGEVIASQNGKRYHYPWCPSARQIADDNKLVFSSIEGARDAGYTPAENCEGLR